MYTLFPPLRNDFVTLRFVQQDGQLRDGDLVEYLEQLAAECETREKLSSVNYVLVPDKGPVELVLNHYKTDNRCFDAKYEAAKDFLADHDYTKRFVLEDHPTMTKYGFDPARLGAYLRGYYKLKLFENRNPHSLVFFDVGAQKRGQRSPDVVALKDSSLGFRLRRMTERLNQSAKAATDAVGGEYVGVEAAKISSQMLRTLFDTWLFEQQPTMEEREFFAKCMCHRVETQMEVYGKTQKRRTADDSTQAKKKNRSMSF
jgi:hypothetical protein